MRSLIFALLLSITAYAAPVAHYGISNGKKLPDKKYTPGKDRGLSKETICKTVWGKDERHVTEGMKKQVCAEYGAKNCPGKGWEIDHLISREVGGADVVENLWPQPAPEYHEKDVIENRLHKEVCAGTVTLQQAQSCLRTDWTTCK